ncbi:complement factor B-like [Nelusetta ayraudi]|uniref:complement factor B-like n=1 Tax=Nelusetta ayraudi TaxID=303726 RepID=UPI003F719111
MGFSVHWHLLAALIGLLYSGGEVLGNCTEKNVQIQGGTYKLTKLLQTGSMLVYECPKNYYPYPDLTRTCHANGMWKPKPLKRPRCKMVECPDPNVLLYGSVSPPQQRYFVGNETMTECYSGYKMRGSLRRVCLPNGKWSGRTPICSRDTGDHCADPGIPAGASRTGNSFGIGDTVRYQCSRKLFLMGSDERVCQENGQWTGIEPSCYFSYTYDTALEVSQVFGREIINSLTNLESVDDTMETRKIRIPKNGTLLNIYIAVDVSDSIEEDYVKNATRAVKELISKISSFAVTPNYEIVFFSSNINQAVNILDFYNGVKVNLREILDNFDTGDRDGGTDLNLVFHHFLERMSFIKAIVNASEFKEQYHVIIVFTDGIYNMGGSPLQTVERIKNMVYLNHTNEMGDDNRVEHLDIYTFGIGVEIFSEDLKRLTVGTGGRHFFKLKDYSNLQEVFDQIIDEAQVKGLCGLHFGYDHVNGTLNERNRRLYPWVASISITLDGTRRNCLGALITPQFVLTAAHCFVFDDLPANINVEINDQEPMRKAVKRLYLHPKYNISAKVKEGVKEFYDYDVALIQLEDPVHISILARPICIPCTLETNTALKLPADSTCLQQRQFLLKNQIEPLNFLTKSNGLQKKTVRAKLGDNRVACISHALQADGITTKKAEVAVTDHFLCTGGLEPERDHIACTGDSGGAVFKTFEHRTVQVGVVSWGTKKQCKGGGLVESNADSRDFHINLFDVVDFLKSILANDAQEDFESLVFLEN